MIKQVFYMNHIFRNKFEISTENIHVNGGERNQNNYYATI